MRQRRPYDLVLPYEVKAARLLKRGVYGSGQVQTTPPAANLCFSNPVAVFNDTTRIDQAKSLAYAKLLSKISDRANWGENIGQYSESVKLARDSLENLAGAVRAFRKKDPTAFGKWMLKGGKGGWFQPIKRVAQGVLVLDFVLLPTLEDIYSAMQILQEPIKNARVRGRAHVIKNVSYDPGTFSSRWVTESGKVLAEYGASIKVDNPNLWLANTMGVLNPAQIAWQLVPGSFLFDWLIPIEQTLGMMTDLLGLEVQSSYSTYAVKSVRTEGFSPGFYQGQTALFSRIDMVRAVGISLPSLRFRPLKVPGMKRLANAGALAIQAFGPKYQKGSFKFPGSGGG